MTFCKAKICRKIISVIMLLSFIYSLTSCSFYNDFNSSKDLTNHTAPTINQTNDNYNPIVEIEEDYTDTENSEYSTVPPLSINFKTYKSVSLDYCYNSLQTKLQTQLYNAIESSVHRISKEKDKDGRYYIDSIYMPFTNIEQSDIRLVLEAFTSDHPEIFWLDNFLTYSNDGFNNMTIQFYSNINASDIKKYTLELEKSLLNILDKLPSNLGEFNRELFLHDTFLKQCTYDYNAINNDDIWASYTSYGALVNGLAVCEGYTKTMQLLLKYAGIESTVSNGKHNGNWHQWNMVKVDDEWYHLDATWDDSDDYIFYSYFNLNDTQISLDRTISEDFNELTTEQICGSDAIKAVLFNINNPICDSDKNNYYVNKSVLFYSFNSDCSKSIEKELLNSAKNQNKSFCIKIANNLDYQYSVNSLFFKEPFKFFEYTTNVNSLLKDKKIDLNKISIIKRENFRVVEIYLNYL